MHHLIIDTELGPILIIARPDKVVRVMYIDDDPGPQLETLRQRLGTDIPGLNLAQQPKGTAPHAAFQCAEEMQQYLAGQRQEFTVPLSLELVTGQFRKAALEALMTVPWGSTVTYSELAGLAGNPRAFRAAASACSNNPLLIVIPCHRVVGRSGLGGYSPSLDYKRHLLQLEGADL